MSGADSDTAALLQQMARSQGGGALALGESPVLGTDKVRVFWARWLSLSEAFVSQHGVAVRASEAELVERDLALLAWQLRGARRRGLTPHPQLLAEQAQLQAQLARLRGRRGWFTR
jgi:hypothetical protein